VKVPHQQFESDPASFARFQREGEIGKKLNHPKILRILDVGEHSRPYIVVEYSEGKTLDQVMNKIRPLPISDAVQIASQVCGGFSPAMGTPDYMAPEQVQGKRGDERTDIYSLGAVLYEMATGSVPFEGDNPFIVMNSRITGDPISPRKLNREIPKEIEQIILHAMEREPHRRYASAAAMKVELDNPDAVKLTGGHQHLQSVQGWKVRWQGSKLTILSALLPVPVCLIGFILVRCHGAPH
jgi:serine/threonine protein kinase